MQYHSDTEFKNISALESAEYETCSFINCQMPKTDLKGLRFIDCDFIDSDLSNAEIFDSSFQDVRFKSCKMLGWAFDTCHDFNFKISFKDCQLDYSIFYQKDMPGTSFEACNLIGVDFTETNLADSVIRECNLHESRFEQSNLEKVDFRYSYNFEIDPEKNKLKEAKFSAENLIGLLYKYGIIVDS